jgi:prepilin-type N-terminal cleavage/methylation domain-containing protein
MEDTRQHQKRNPPIALPPAIGLRVARRQGGFTLIEMLIATMLLGVVISVFLATLATGSRAVEVVDTRLELTRLAQSQMETTLSQPFLTAPASYPSIAAPPGYAVTAVAELLAGASPNIQRVVVSVYRDGEQRRTLEAFKFNQ